MLIWWIMLITDLLLPVIMTVAGFCFFKRPPRHINRFLGYRTSRSVKNEKTWDFAHRYFGKMCAALGLVILLPSLIPFIFINGKSDETVALAGLIIALLQALLFSLSIILTERALKREFEENDNQNDAE